MKTIFPIRFYNAEKNSPRIQRRRKNKQLFLFLL